MTNVSQFSEPVRSSFCPSLKPLEIRMIQKKGFKSLQLRSSFICRPTTILYIQKWKILFVLMSLRHVKANPNMACDASLAICFPRLVYQQSMYMTFRVLVCACVCLSAVGDGRCWVSLAVNVYKTWVGLKVERKGQSTVSIFGLFFFHLSIFFCIQRRAKCGCERVSVSLQSNNPCSNGSFQQPGERLLQGW